MSEMLRAQLYREGWAQTFGWATHGVPFSALDPAIEFLAEQMVKAGVTNISFTPVSLPKEQH